MLKNKCRNDRNGSSELDGFPTNGLRAARPSGLEGSIDREKMDELFGRVD